MNWTERCNASTEIYIDLLFSGQYNPPTFEPSLEDLEESSYAIPNDKCNKETEEYRIMSELTFNQGINIENIYILTVTKC